MDKMIKLPLVVMLWALAIGIASFGLYMIYLMIWFAAHPETFV